MRDVTLQSEPYPFFVTVVRFQGPPSTWTSSVLDQLSQLILILHHSILQSIPKNVLMPWLENSILHSDLSQNQLVHIRGSLKPSRTKREIAMCPEDKVITEEILNDDLMDELLFYTPIFPEGYPPAVFSNLGLIEKLIDEKKIKQWTINSTSTVHALLDSVPSDE
ncbi:hypothetical protein L345_17051, partial [Ophiophagus hannah]